MRNIKEELLEHIESRRVAYVQLECNGLEVEGTLEEVLVALGEAEYNAGYGTQELFGTIWYEDGTWSERGEYDGSEFWEYKVCPKCPAKKTFSMSGAAWIDGEQVGYMQGSEAPFVVWSQNMFFRFMKVRHARV